MPPRLFPALLALLSSAVALAQPAPAPAFENVFIHAAAPGLRTQAIGRFNPGARFEIRGFTMLDLIEQAYGAADRDWIRDGPDWLNADKFDIVAEVPASARPGSRRAMFQALLAERFGLVVHRERQPAPVYALAAGKRPLLKESSGGNPGCSATGWDVLTMACTNVDMKQFASELQNTGAGYFDRPLVDRTGLTGRYDLTLHWTPFYQIGAHAAEGQQPALSPSKAIESQLGLRIDSVEEPVSVLVVDGVNRTPTPNAPGVEEALQTASLTEFEVAEVRPHKPGSEFKFATYDSEADMLGLPVGAMIFEAYGFRGEELTGGPSWVNTQAYDVIAKAPRRVPWENMQIMLQNLLQKTFHLAWHIEPRPIDAYALVTFKATPNLKAANPNSRSDCRVSTGSGGRTISCRNTTMARFAERARELTGDFPSIPIADLTELRGGFDFALTWMPPPLGSSGPRPPAATGATGEASTPSGQLTFAEALEKQLGLRLRKQKLPMPVMVIDHIEPLAN